VGSFFRTSDAFAIEKIYLCGITAKPPHREITKTAIGATHSVDWEYVKDIAGLLTNLKSEGKRIIGIEQTDESIPLGQLTVNPKDHLVVIFGNEVQGLKDIVLPLMDDAVEIPQYGTKHSLNVSVCGGIVLYDLVIKLKE
jgi:tRNA G18 (ribose-2'-O)-methylase SpoU